MKKCAIRTRQHRWGPLPHAADDSAWCYMQPPRRQMLVYPSKQAEQWLPASQGYTPAVDLWSAGVILFCLLAYHHPFEEIESDAELWERIRSGEPDIIEYEWEYVSEDAKDLVVRPTPD